MDTVKSFVNEAMKLDGKSRAKIAQELIDSLDDTELDSQWIDLAEKRLKDLTEGSVEGRNWEQIKPKV